MSPRFIVHGQPVSQEKVQMAKDLRRNMTEAERVLWQHLRTNQLDRRHFRRQQIIAGFIVDFYCHSASLIVEVDGEVHQRQIQEDNERDQALRDLGLRILRFENQTVFADLNSVLEKIAEACRHSPPLPGEGLWERSADANKT
jgi:very-short-patch-repair endonuclease